MKSWHIVAYFSIIFLCLCFATSPAFPENAGNKKPDGSNARKVTVDGEKFDEMLQTLKSLQEQVKSLQNEVEELKSEKSSRTSPNQSGEASQDGGSQSVQSGASETLPQNEGASAGESPESAQSPKEAEIESTESESPPPQQATQGMVNLNPRISVIGDFVWRINHDKKLDGGDPFNFREVEIAFQSNIDPWSRADFFTNLEKEEGEIRATLEEGYLTFNRMPFDTQVRAGRFFLPFGKDNATHQHARPYVDTPLMIRNFFGEDEGQKGTGFEVSALLPTGNIYTELTADVVNDEGDASFSNGASDRPLYLGHLRSYFDLDESSNIELGYSHLRGYNDELALRMSQIHGVDLTYRWRPPASGNYNSFLLRGEHLWSHRENADRNVDSRGYYGFAQYQLDRNWYIGARYDYSEFPDIVDSNERALSGILTYFPTEFSYYRLQYTNTERNYAPNCNQWLFQINFLMGPHGAHKF